MSGYRPPPLTADQRAERDAVKAGRMQVSPAARYYPVARPPLRPDGSLDVAELCRRWDDAYNSQLP